MTLSILERVLLYDCLPATGDIGSIKTIQALRSDLAFSEAEVEAIQLKQEGDQVRWAEPEGYEPKDISITPKGQQILMQALEKLSGAQKLTAQHIPLYERFCGDKG